MKFFKTKVCKEKIKKLVKCSCDLCGKESAFFKSYSNKHDWTKQGEMAEMKDTSLIECEVGHDGIVSKNTEKISVDICPDCFQNKLVPWLKSQGVKIKKEKIVIENKIEHLLCFPED